MSMKVEFTDEEARAVAWAIEEYLDTLEEDIKAEGLAPGHPGLSSSRRLWT